jgi:hypothetical protein
VPSSELRQGSRGRLADEDGRGLLDTADVVALVGSVRILASSSVDPVATVPIDGEQTGVIPEAAGYVVAARTAIEQSVTALLSGETVGAPAPGDPVLAAPAAEDVVATSAGDDVGV